MSALLARHPVMAFALLALLLGWAAALAGMPDYIVGTTPLLAALTCQWRLAGMQGVVALLRRAYTPDLNRAAFLLAVVLPIGVLLAAILIGTLRHSDWPVWRDTVRAAPLAFAGLLVAVAWNGPGEEPGWRGFALPRLLASRSPLVATLLVAAVWIPWHYPVLYARGEFTLLLVPAFSLALLFGAIWLTTIYRVGGGSVFACVVWHALWNVVATIGRHLSPSVFPWMGALVALIALGLLAWQWRDWRQVAPPARSR